MVHLFPSYFACPEISDVLNTFLRFARLCGTGQSSAIGKDMPWPQQCLVRYLMDEYALNVFRLCEEVGRSC